MFTAFTGERLADGSAAHTVKVTLKDANGNGVPNEDTSKLSVAGSKAISVRYDDTAVTASGNTTAVFVAGGVPPEEPPAEEELPVTGFAALSAVLAGILLLGAGGLLLLLSRRRSREQ